MGGKARRSWCIIICMTSLVIASLVSGVPGQDVPAKKVFLPHRYGYEPYRECPPVELARQFCMRHTASTLDFMRLPSPVQECMRSICPAPHRVVSQYCLWKNFDFCTQYAEKTADRNGPRAIAATRECLQRMCDSDRVDGISAHRPSTLDASAVEACCQRGEITPAGCYVMYSHRQMGQLR